MPYKDKSRHIEYLRKWRIKNHARASELSVIGARRNYSKNYKLVSEYKKDKPCLDCKNIFPAVAMDFDHVRDKKVKNVSSMLRNSSWKTIEKEIKKCDLVCSNCHRVRTHKRTKAQSSNG